MVFFVFRIGNHTNFSQYFQAISAAKHLKLAPFGSAPDFSIRSSKAPNIFFFFLTFYGGEARKLRLCNNMF